MTKTLKTLFAAAFASSAVLAVGAPAYAATTSEQIEMCAIALDEQGIASRDAYDVKFVSKQGGALKTLTLKLKPVAEGDDVTAFCKVRRGKVTEVALDV